MLCLCIVGANAVVTVESTGDYEFWLVKLNKAIIYVSEKYCCTIHMVLDLIKGLLMDMVEKEQLTSNAHSYKYIRWIDEMKPYPVNQRLIILFALEISVALGDRTRVSEFD